MRKIQDLKYALNLARNMGWRYVGFRIFREITTRSGLLKHRFPTNPVQQTFISLTDWRKLEVKFFLNGKDSLKLPKNPVQSLRQKYTAILEGKLVFFNNITFDIGKDYNWITNPDNGYVYDINKHWTQIPDYSRQAGDIKYVWEKSRFSFLFDIIRFDYHFETDCSQIVFSEILSWIKANPINQGPNYRCSQEITLRIFNWLFALYYYNGSAAITESLFQQIMHHVYWQIKHVYRNIRFSRIAVRNNHAITETLGLYIFGVLFPFFPEARTWEKKGRKWFEEEVAYQVYPDGTYLQFSMNYHRVVIQLLTLGIRFSQLNNKTLAPVVYDRAHASLNFLHNCSDPENGQVPNYGANDGSLFFPLNNSDFADYRPQLQALATALNESIGDYCSEDPFWLGMVPEKKRSSIQHEGSLSFPFGGYYLLRDGRTLTFIRCGNHRDRPSQADNLHLDVWINGKNILRDSGSYKYNTDDQTLRYFFGTMSHNTVALGNNDQMKKGKRFIWYYWTQAKQAAWAEHKEYFEFTGVIRAFGQLDKNIHHKRVVRKYKSKTEWEITDEVFHHTSLMIRQLWHPHPGEIDNLNFSARDQREEPIKEIKIESWHSAAYGSRDRAETIIFSTDARNIKTTIHFKPSDQ